MKHRSGMTFVCALPECQYLAEVARLGIIDGSIRLTFPEGFERTVEADEWLAEVNRCMVRYCQDQDPRRYLGMGGNRCSPCYRSGRSLTESSYVGDKCPRCGSSEVLT